MTGNRVIDILLYIIIAVILLWVLFIVIDKLDDESDGAFIVPVELEWVA